MKTIFFIFSIGFLHLTSCKTTSNTSSHDEVIQQVDTPKSEAEKELRSEPNPQQLSKIPLQKHEGKPEPIPVEEEKRP